MKHIVVVVQRVTDMRFRHLFRFRLTTGSVYWSIATVYFVQLALFGIRSADAIVCTGCTAEERQNCPSVDDCRGGRTLDPCDCCLECARVEDETCGGRYRAEGQCDLGLVCVITPVPGAVITGEDVGTCRAIPSVATPMTSSMPHPVTSQRSADTDRALPSICADIDCSAFVDDVIAEAIDAVDNKTNVVDDVNEQPDCPPDSIFVPTISEMTLLDDRSRLCCDVDGQPRPRRRRRRQSQPPTPSTDTVGNWSTSSDLCRCLPCPASDDDSVAFNECPDGQVRVLKVEGQPDTPGQCCDVFECIDHAKFCDDVECDVDPNHEDLNSCPDDSFRLPKLVTQDGCCTVEQGCQCNSLDSCADVTCPDGLKKRIRQIATGLPGYCCDVYDCVNGTSAVCLHNSTVRADGDRWTVDDCTSCRCRDGLSFCEPVHCPTLSRCGWIGTPQGSCCPVCKGCVSQHGDLQPSGSTWQLDSCVTCRCDDGQVYCQAQMCSVSCVNPTVVPGECCPLCDDYAVVTMAPHCPSLSNCTLMCSLGYVRAPTGCYQCRCVEPQDDPCDLDCPGGYRLDLLGLEVCDCVDVPDNDYIRPVAVVTAAPNVDDQPDDDVDDHDETETIGHTPAVIDVTVDVNQEGNVTESSSDDSTTSSTLKSMSPSTVVAGSGDSDVPLSPPVMLPTCPPLPLGCAKQCLYGYRVDRYGCPRCRCNRCPPFECTKRCRDGYAFSGAGCRLCRCLDTNFIDTTVSSVPPPNGQTVDSLDGPSGTRQCISADGERTIEDGQSWWDGCRRCFCREGHEMCALTTCPALRCINPVFRSDSCCPSCPGETAVMPYGSTSLCHLDNGRYYANGDTWQLDDCTLCICHQGTPLCIVDSCPPTLCRHPVLIPKMCCPICPDDDGYLPPSTLSSMKTSHRSCRSASSGRRYASGDTWRVDACQSCTCRDGQIHCFAQTCPITPCKRPVLKKGHCCPICTSMPVVEFCAYAGNTYQVGESWLVDDCTQCTCVDSVGGVAPSAGTAATGVGGHPHGTGGQILCTIAVCDSVALATCSSFAAPTPGTCCPVCLDVNILASNNSIDQATGIVIDIDSSSTYGSTTAATKTTTILIVFIIILSLLVLVLLLTLFYTRRLRRRRHGNHVIHDDLLSPHCRHGCGPFGTGPASVDEDDEAEITRYHRPSLAKSSPPSSPRSAPPRYIDASQQHLGTGSSSDGGRGSDDVDRHWSNDEDVSGGADNDVAGDDRSLSVPSSSTSTGRLPPVGVTTTVPDIWLTMTAAAEKKRLEQEGRDDRFVGVDEADSAVDDVTGSDDEETDATVPCRRHASSIHLDIDDDEDDDDLDAASHHSSSSETSSAIRNNAIARLSTIDCDVVDDDDEEYTRDDVCPSSHLSGPGENVRCSGGGEDDNGPAVDEQSKRLLPPVKQTSPRRQQIDPLVDDDDDVFSGGSNRRTW